jgi:hypothetical protein
MTTSRKLLVVIASAALGTLAFGDSLKLSTSSYSNGSNGGAYTAMVLSGPANNSSYNALAVLSPGTFETFCLEPTEYFSPGSTYDYTIGSFADGGANEAAGRNSTFGDQLSLGTSWLYSQFATGSLSSATYNSATRQSSYLALQRAFWYLEDDYTAYGSEAGALANNAYLSLVASHFSGSLAAAQADAANGANGVWALNITTVSGQNVIKNQSQLYFNVTPTTNKVPEQGATFALMGLAVLGLAAVRRKFVSAK